MEESTLLRKIYIREKESDLNKDTVFGIPLWRIVRYNSRLYYITKNTNYKSGTTDPVFVGSRKMKFLSGYWKYIFKKRLNIFYAFSRLVNNNGLFLDKFVDPIVEATQIKDENYVIIDSPNYVGDYPRIHKDHVINNETRTISRQILKNLMSLIVPFFMKNRIRLLFTKSQTIYELPDNFIKQYNWQISLFVADYLYNYFWFRILRPRRVLIVYRESYFAQIAVCKRLGIPVAEFQHGITLDKTVSFTGDYDYRIDPDYFFTFGKYWKSDNFGMIDEKIFCSGWAYSQFVNKQIKAIKKNSGTALIISSPEISDMILEAVTMLSLWQPSMKYHIRLHPNESYNSLQMKKLSLIPQAELADNKIDSAVVLPLYEYVLGENSSVLYEALSMGCKVGLLNICGLRPPVDKSGISESFYIVNNHEDYNTFLHGIGKNNEHKESFYSEFDRNIFENFISENL